MSQAVMGGCLCEEIEFTFESSCVLDAYHCSCRGCQKLTGTTKSSYVVMHSDDFHLLTGSLSLYEFSSDHGDDFVIGFCINCGCNIAAYHESNKSITSIPIGILDDSNWVQVKTHRWTDNSCTWDKPTPDLQAYKTKPLSRW